VHFEKKCCVINVKYKEISWRVRRRKKKRKKVTSRSTEEFVLKNIVSFLINGH